MSQAAGYDDADERLAISRIIGYQINCVTKATHLELDQWEKCVAWARAQYERPNPRVKKPYVPTHLCVPFEEHESHSSAVKQGKNNNGKQSKQQPKQQHQL